MQWWNLKDYNHINNQDVNKTNHLSFIIQLWNIFHINKNSNLQEEKQRQCQGKGYSHSNK